MALLRLCSHSHPHKEGRQGKSEILPSRCKAAVSAANPHSFVRNLLQLLQLWSMNVLSEGNTFQPLAGLWEGFKVRNPNPLLMPPKLPVGL